MTRRSLPVSTTIEQSGVSLLVEGTYMPALPPRLTADPYNSEEGETGYWIEYAIYIGGVDVTELLEWISMIGAVERILEKAAEQI